MVRVPDTSPPLSSCRGALCSSDLTLMAEYRCSRSGIERDIELLGIVHNDNVVDVRPLHQLHPTTEEDTSCPRDRSIDFCR